MGSAIVALSKNGPKDMASQEAEGKALVSLGKCEVLFMHSTRGKQPEGKQRSHGAGQEQTEGAFLC